MNDQKLTKNHFQNWRIILLYAVIGLIFVFFIFRLFNLQIINGARYIAQALDNRKTTISVPTQRGIIYDRNGIILAQNIPSYNVVITPALLPGDNGAISGTVAGPVQTIYRQLSQLIGIPASQGTINKDTVSTFTPCNTDLGITQIVIIGATNSPYDPIRIQCDINPNTAMVVREKAADWPGVSIEVEPVRDYPTGALTAQVIGFLGPVPAVLQDYYVNQGFVANRDKVGYAGIESTMQDVLGGKNGSEQVEVDVAGQEVGLLAAPVTPIPGDNLVLTIDTRLQQVAQTALKEEIDYLNSHTQNGKILTTSGVVIAINPKTGEILSLVTYPTYENNRMARVIPSYYYNQLKQDPAQPLFDTAISAELPPGSVFKMAAAVGALNEGVVTPDFTINDPGFLNITEKYYANDPGHPRKFFCWERGGHGTVDFLHGIAWSCDVYFYNIGGGSDAVLNGGLGIWRLGEYAKALGYGKVTGIELPGEAAGLIPTPDWKRLNLGENWSTGDTYIATIGQGYVLSTPLQVLDSYVAIINNGKIIKPTLIKEIQNPQGQVIKPFQPQMLWDITKDPIIHSYNNDIPTGEMKTVQPWTLQLIQQGLRMVTQEGGTAYTVFQNDPLQTAGKSGTAEYCDNIAQAANRCIPDNWPSHAWYVGYAPYDNPEIAVVTFIYNGTEGSTSSGPVVRKVLDAYFALKASDAAQGKP